MWVWVTIMVALLVGYVCSRIAAGKGRSPWGFGRLGFFLPLIGLIVVAVIPRRQTSPS
jgi:hypothetical protein